MDQIYKVIRKRREELGISQGELASAVGYTSKSTMSRVESGQIDLPISMLLKIANVLKLPISDLLEQEGESAVADKGTVFTYLSEDEADFIDSLNRLKPKERMLVKGIITLMIDNYK